MKLESIVMNGVTIRRVDQNGMEMLCLTDMRQGFPESKTIENWIRNSATLDFLADWERIVNPNFKDVGYDSFTENAGYKTFRPSVGAWLAETNAKGMYVEKGKYGGTYAWVDIATEFAMYLSSAFKVRLIIEHRLLLQKSNTQLFTDSRILAAKYYTNHTDAVEEFRIQGKDLPQRDKNNIYAEEGDVLNLACFKQEAWIWRQNNPNLVVKVNNRIQNMRDYATPIQLIVLHELEIVNAYMIEEGYTTTERVKKLSVKCDKLTEKYSKWSEDKLTELVSAVKMKLN